MLEARPAYPASHPQTRMEEEFLDYFCCESTGYDGPEEQWSGKSSWILESNDLLEVAHFLTIPSSYSHYDAGSKQLQGMATGLCDSFLDIPSAHEDLIWKGPDASRVPQRFMETSAELPSALPDSTAHYGSVDWTNFSQGGAFYDDLLGGPLDVPFTDDSAPQTPVSTSHHDEDFFFEQLRHFLETDAAFPPVLSFASDTDSQMDTRPTSAISTYSSAADLSPVPTMVTASMQPSRKSSRAKPAPVQSKTASRRPYTRRAMQQASPSPSISVSSYSSSIKKPTKVTPKKRKQNRKAAGDYRRRKRVLEDGQTEEHESLLTIRDDLKKQQEALEQELRFALKLAITKLKMMV